MENINMCSALFENGLYWLCQIIFANQKRARIFENGETVFK